MQKLRTELFFYIGSSEVQLVFDIYIHFLTGLSGIKSGNIYCEM